MRLCKQKLYLAMARAIMNPNDVARAAEMPRGTMDNAIRGDDVRPATVGKIAKALGIDPAELIEED